MTAFDWSNVSEDDIISADRVQLREWATVGSAGYYNSRRTLASVEFTSEVLATGGILTTLDKLASQLRTAYGTDEDIRVDIRYSTWEVTAWNLDESLRSNLKYSRRYALEAAEKEAAEKD